MKPKLKPEVFEAAAERIADGRNSYCCAALGAALLSDYLNYRSFLTEIFKPKNAESHHPWWGWGYDKNKDQEARIIALLLCGEMCRKPKRKKP